MYYTIVYFYCDSGAFGQRGQVLIGPPSCIYIKIQINIFNVVRAELQICKKEIEHGGQCLLLFPRLVLEGISLISSKILQALLREIIAWTNHENYTHGQQNNTFQCKFLGEIAKGSGGFTMRTLVRGDSAFPVWWRSAAVICFLAD